MIDLRLSFLKSRTLKTIVEMLAERNRIHGVTQRILTFAGNIVPSRPVVRYEYGRLCLTRLLRTQWS